MDLCLLLTRQTGLMEIYDVQLDPTGALIDWPQLILWGVLALAGLIAAVFLFPGKRPSGASWLSRLAASLVGVAIALVAGALAISALQGVQQHHISGIVENQGTVDGHTWVQVESMPFPVIWEGHQIPDDGRLGGLCTEGSPVAGIEWTCAPPR